MDKKEKKEMAEESSSRLFRRVVGFMFVLYGFFAFVDPEGYSFGGMPSDYTQITGLLLVTIGLFLILRKGKIIG